MVTLAFFSPIEGAPSRLMTTSSVMLLHWAKPVWEPALKHTSARTAAEMVARIFIVILTITLGGLFVSYHSRKKEAPPQNGTAPFVEAVGLLTYATDRCKSRWQDICYK